MPARPSPVPAGFNTVSPYLIVPNCVKALEFYAKALGATEGMRMAGPDGESTMHAEMKVGNSTIMLSDENPQWGMKSPLTLGGSAVSIHLYVEDADAAFNRAVAAGCTAGMPMMDMFWGDRFGKFKDPFGHDWSVATHVEDVPPEEMAKRAEAEFAKMAAGEGCK